mmetsp:Transcript_15830/g.37312  ORF Transcript_15830/g.37312 Transcript_15830/m.37312 type:complete len:275 (+) Transcript_15830:310-1134(+)
MRSANRSTFSAALEGSTRGSAELSLPPLPLLVLTLLRVLLLMLSFFCRCLRDLPAVSLCSVGSWTKQQSPPKVHVPRAKNLHGCVLKFLTARALDFKLPLFLDSASDTDAVSAALASSGTLHLFPCCGLSNLGLLTPHELLQEWWPPPLGEHTASDQSADETHDPGSRHTVEAVSSASEDASWSHCCGCFLRFSPPANCCSDCKVSPFVAWCWELLLLLFSFCESSSHNGTAVWNGHSCCCCCCCCGGVEVDCHCGSGTKSVVVWKGHAQVAVC